MAPVTYRLATGRYVVRNLLLPAVFGIGGIGLLLITDASSLTKATLTAFMVLGLMVDWFLREFVHPPLTIDGVGLTMGSGRHVVVIPWDDIDPHRSRWSGGRATLIRRSVPGARAMVITTAAYEKGLTEALRCHWPATPAIG